MQHNTYAGTCYTQIYKFN
uniref:Uncharacterized protein n=1 Tax=Rhizophora mucronata TaxID=61149 RepID=A0A2P2Q2C5_RHIMU